MDGVADRKLREALAALASPQEPPAAGVAVALAGALAASQVELSASLAARRLGGDPERLDPEGAERMTVAAGRAGELRTQLLRAADEDVEAYGHIARAEDSGGKAEALAAAADPPLAIAEIGAELAEVAAETAASSAGWAFAADAAVAGELAAAVARGAARLVEANLDEDSGDPRLAGARDAAARATAATRG